MLAPTGGLVDVRGWLGRQSFARARVALERARADGTLAEARARDPSEALSIEAELLICEGRWCEAALLLEEQLPATDVTPGSAGLRNLLGVSYKYSGRFHEAESIYLALLTDAQREPIDGVAMATLMHNLGGVAHARGDYEHALRWALKGLSTRRALLPPSALDIAADELALAAILDGCGRSREAETIYREHLKTSEVPETERRYDLGVLQNNLGANLLRQGRLEEAAALLRTALKTKAEALGARHPDVGLAHHNLAVCHERAGELALAFEHGQRAVAGHAQ